MKVTTDVVNDLLPLYEAGEASADTRALVEDFFRENPEFERQVSARTALADSLQAPPFPNPTPSLERTTLERTRRFIRTRTFFLGLAIALWVIPFAFTFDEHGLRWIMWRDNPLQAIFCIAVSTAISTVQTILDWRRGREAKRG
ncbi:MAG TPA: hypothetical protein VI198_05665 [Candidatus Eisenbacteria bacterium]